MNRISLCVALTFIGLSWGDASADDQGSRGGLDSEAWYGVSTNPIPGISGVPKTDYWTRNVQKLMSLLGVNVGKTNDVCRSWEAPDEILVGKNRYDVRVAKDGGISVELNGASNEAARCYMVQYADARRARRAEFISRLGLKEFSPLSGSNRKPWEVKSLTVPTSHGGWSLQNVAHRTIVFNVDSATNALYVTSKGARKPFDALVYRNLVLSIQAPTNAVEIAVALMNAGLPEDERIVVSPHAP